MAKARVGQTMGSHCERTRPSHNHDTGHTDHQAHGCCRLAAPHQEMTTVTPPNANIPGVVGSCISQPRHRHSTRVMHCAAPYTRRWYRTRTRTRRRRRRRGRRRRRRRWSHSVREDAPHDWQDDDQVDPSHVPRPFRASTHEPATRGRPPHR